MKDKCMIKLVSAAYRNIRLASFLVTEYKKLLLHFVNVYSFLSAEKLLRFL